jgi:multicomponent Na+:H+ antiporter subunit D
VNVLVPLPIVLPLLGAAISMSLHRRTRVQRFLGVAIVAATLATSVVLLVRVADEGPVSAQVGGWSSPIGITLVVDLFSALVLVTATTCVLAVLCYAIGSRRTRDEELFFHPVYLVLTAGVAASLLTGDLFNLFVAFEVMLVSSYVLITLGGAADQVRSAMTYVVINLIASTLFITAVGLVYAATGTVDMAALSVRMPEIADGVRDALALLLLVVFGIKAAIFPLFFWLPDSYPTAPTPVTAVFAGLLTKVGVYAIVRTQTLLFPETGPSALILVIAGATMIVGVLGAIAQEDMKRMLSFHIVSQIGYMIFGLGLFSVAGIAGAIIFVVHQIVVKTTLFLVTGIIEETHGTAALRRLGGLVHETPFVAALYLLSALSLAGLPPFSGFVAKLALVEAGIAARSWAIVAVSLFASLLTLFSMTKIWNGVFWGTPEEPPATDAGAAAPPARIVAPTAGLVAVGLAIAVLAGPLYELSHEAAETLVERDPYVEEVRGP